MNKVLANILEKPVPKGLSIPKVQTLIKEVAMLDTNSKLVYSASGERIIKELDKYGVKDIPQNYRGVLLEHWLELLSQTQETITEVPKPTGPDATTLTSDQLTDLGESAEKRAQQKATIQAREKEAVAKFQKQGKKRFRDQQKEEALKEKRTQDLLNQFFKSKVVVIPTEEINPVASETPTHKQPKVNEGETWRFSFTGQGQSDLDAQINEILESKTSQKIKPLVVPGGVQFEFFLPTSAVISLKSEFEQLTATLQKKSTAQTPNNSLPMGIVNMSWYKKRNLGSRKIPSGNVLVIVWISTL